MTLSPDFPLGVELEVFIRREDADGFIEEVRGDDPEMATKLRIEERELEAGAYPWRSYADPLMAPDHFAATLDERIGCL